MIPASDSARLAGILPAMLAGYERLYAAAGAAGIAVRVNDDGYAGLRTTAQQAQLSQWEADSVATGQGAYAVAAPGKSRHEIGAAVDVRIVSHKEKSSDAAYKKLADIGRSVGLTAGYYFKSVPSDPYHFELPGSFVDLRAEYLARGDLPRRSTAAAAPAAADCRCGAAPGGAK